MRPRVLIVEDSALVVGALRILLEERGFDVEAASGVQDAVAACRAARPDVMLLDLGLRDGHGLDVLAVLADDAQLPTVVVAVTGDDSPDVRDRCLAAGCREVLVKPMSPLQLPAKLHAMLAE